MKEKIDNITYGFKNLIKILTIKRFIGILLVVFIPSILSSVLAFANISSTISDSPVFYIATVMVGFLSLWLHNAVFNSLKMYILENKIPVLKDFLRLGRLNIGNYIIVNFAIALASTFLSAFFAWFIGTFVNIDFFYSFVISLFLTSLINTRLLFSGYVTLAKKDSIKRKVKKTGWLVFGILRFFILLLSNFTLATDLFNLIYMMFCLICILKEDAFCDNKE